MDHDDLWKSGSDYVCRWDGLGNSRLATLAASPHRIRTCLSADYPRTQGFSVPGGLDSPSKLLPQQAMVPSLRTPQVNSPFALTQLNVPAGGVDSP